MATATANTPTANRYDTLKAWLSAEAQAKMAGSLPDKDDGGQAATTGSHAAEVERELKKKIPGQNVESAGENTKKDDNQGISGLEQAEVGKMPDVEKAVKTVSEESEKLASADLTTDAGLDAAFEALVKASAELPKICVSLGVKAGVAAANTNKSAAAKTQTPADQAAAAFGYATKEAADKAAAAVIEGYRRYGAERGELTGHCLRGIYEVYGRLKQAADEGNLAAMLGMDGGAAPTDPAAAAAQAPPAPAGEAGAGAGAEGAPGDAAGPSVDDFAGAMPELNLSPEELQQLLAMLKEKLEAGSAAPEGQMPPEEKAAFEAAIANGVKLAHDIQTHMRSGKFQLKPANDGKARANRDTAKQYFIELLNAAR